MISKSLLHSTKAFCGYTARYTAFLILVHPVMSVYMRDYLTHLVFPSFRTLLAWSSLRGWKPWARARLAVWCWCGTEKRDSIMPWRSSTSRRSVWVGRVTVIQGHMQDGNRKYGDVKILLTRLEMFMDFGKQAPLYVLVQRDSNTGASFFFSSVLWTSLNPLVLKQTSAGVAELRSSLCRSQQVESLWLPI